MSCMLRGTPKFLKTSGMRLKNVRYATLKKHISFFNLAIVDGTPLPADVILHGNEHGLKGVNYWPQYSHREVVDLIDKLKKPYKQDFDRVPFIILIFIILQNTNHPSLLYIFPLIFNPDSVNFTL